MFDEFDHPMLQWAMLAFVLCFGAIVIVFTSSREPPPPVPIDAMDGLYVNDKCPSFEIRDGVTYTGEAELPGEVTRSKMGYRLFVEGGLYFERIEGECRLVSGLRDINLTAERKSFASPTIMILLFSSDLKSSSYWTRRSLPISSPQESLELGQQR